MKKVFMFSAIAALMIGMASCGGSTTTSNGNNSGDNAALEDYEKNTTNLPWNFPDYIKNEGLAEGQNVLSIHSFHFKFDEAQNPADETYIFYNGTLEKIGDTVSTIKGIGSNEDMPNSVIIPIPQGQTAKVGDIVLTWWQSGSGMERAIVTDASDPKSPKVVYLDMDWKEDGTGSANKHADEQLKPNTFVVLKNNEWQPGAQVYIPDDSNTVIGTLICCNDEKVLISGFAGKISAYYRQYCKIVPTEQNLNVGDNVMAEWVGSFRSGYKVKKIDKKNGRVWVEGDFGEEIKSILDVVKE